MGFFDDLKVRAEQSVNIVSNDINTYIQTRLTDAVVKVGEAPKGNLSAAQIAAGQTGQTASVAAPSGASVQNSSQASQLSSGIQQYLLPIALAVGISFFLFSKKSRG